MKSQLKKFKHFLKHAYKIVICCHENPDPDAIASCIALEYLLTQLEYDVICINSDATPHNLLSLDYRNKVMSLEEETNIPTDIEDYSAIIVDTNDFNDIGKVKEEILDKVKSIFFVDHHSIQISENLQNMYLNSSASSTSEIIYDLYKKFQIEVPLEVCNALYAGILFDTGSFHYPKTSYNTFRIASQMIKKGTNPNDIYLMIYEHETIEYIKALSKVMSTLELYHDNQIALIKLTARMLEDTGALYEECTDFINIPLKSKNVRVVIYCKENEQGYYKISLRSKKDVDVAKIAFLYSGGGHKNASGFKLHGDLSLDETVQSVINYFKQVL